MSDKMQKMVGRRLKGYDMNKAGVLVLRFEDGDVGLEPEGDCCANAFWDMVDGAVDLRRPGVVAEIDEYGESPEGLNGGDDAVDLTFLTIKTDSARYCFIMRTEHNGYYGGWFNVIDPYPYVPTLCPCCGLTEMTREMKRYSEDAWCGKCRGLQQTAWDSLSHDEQRAASGIPEENRPTWFGHQQYASRYVCMPPRWGADAVAKVRRESVDVARMEKDRAAAWAEVPEGDRLRWWEKREAALRGSTTGFGDEKTPQQVARERVDEPPPGFENIIAFLARDGDEG